MKRIAASLLALLLVIAPTSVRPLGLGEIKLQSHLSEPLSAQIPVLSLGNVDLTSIRVELASKEQFARAGIDRPFHLSAIRFAFVGEGESSYISVTTREPLNEPFLNFLLEVDWSNGRLIREYTMLLDPPVYGAAIETNAPAVMKTAEKALPVATAPKPVPQRSEAGTGVAAGGTYGPVKANDTLWKLAERFRPGADVSVQQMMLAMLRLNPAAFQRGNINLLKKGVILDIPSAVEAKGLDRQAALAEVQRQHAAWQDFRRAGKRQVSPTTAAASSPKTTADSGSSQAKVTPSQPEASKSSRPKAPETAPGSDGKLTLSSGGTAAGAVGASAEGSAEISALRSELESVREDADASRREAEELAARVEEAEALVQELERLVRLRDADLAALQDQLAKTQSGVSAKPAETPSAAQSPKPASQPVTPSQAPPPAAPTQAAPSAPVQPIASPSSEKPTGVVELIQSALGDIVPFDPVLLIGGIILVIVIAVVGIVFSRRRNAEAEDEALAELDVVDDGSELTFDSEPALDEPPGTASASESTELGAEVDNDTEKLTSPESETQRRFVEEDPLAEVNVYLAYERFEQAESLVRGVIEADPAKPDYRLKLLEIYHASKNAVAFTAAAEELQTLVGEDHAMMETARQWWGDISPGSELFARTADAAMSSGAEDVFEFDTGSQDDSAGVPPEALETMAELSDGTDTSSVDFDLGFDIEDSEPGALGEGTSVEFDIGRVEDDAAGSETDLDFDLGDLDASLGEETGAETDLDFDLDALDGGEGLAASTEATTTPEGGLVLPVEEAEFEVTPIGEDTGLDFSLDDGSMGIEGPGVMSDELVLDDPTETFAEGASSDQLRDTAATELPGEDSQEMDLDFGDTTELPGAETDLDLVLDEPSATVAGARDSLDLGPGGDTDLDFDLGSFSADGSTALESDDALGAATGEESELDLDLELDSLAETSELPQFGDSERTQRDTEENRDNGFDLEIPGSDIGQTGDALERDILGSDTGESTDDFDFDSLAGEPEDSGSDQLATITMAAPAETNPVEPDEGGEAVDFLLELDDDTATGESSSEAANVEPLAETSDVGLELTLENELEPPDSIEALGEASEIDEDFAALFEDTEADPDMLSLEIEDGGDSQERTSELVDLELQPQLSPEQPDEITDDPIETTGATEDAELDLDALLEVGTVDRGPDGLKDDDELTELNLDTLDVDAPDNPDLEMLDLDLGAFGEEPEEVGGSTSVLDFDFDTLELGDESGLVEPVDDEHEIIDDESESVVAPEPPDEHKTVMIDRSAEVGLEQIQTKLDLAQAYVDMGDTDGAKGILAEVMAEGDAGQRDQAEALLKSID